MLTIYSVVEALSGISIALGVGSSTYAILFYFMAMRNPALRDAGKPYQKIVYTVLRVAMILILLTELAKIGFYMYLGAGVAELLASGALVLVWTIVAVLFINAILMTLHKMPMMFGPAIQATSWYTLGIVTALPVVTFSYVSLMLVYLAGILLVAVAIRMISQKLSAPAMETVVVTETVTVSSVEK